MKIKAYPTPRGYERRMPLDLSSPCQLWSGSAENGYGVVMVDGVTKYVHRLAYQLHVGPIPRGWEIDHVCHTAAVMREECSGGECEHRLCFNPAHLEIVSSRENSMRGNHPLFAVSRKKICMRGHDLTRPENVARDQYNREYRRKTRGAQ